MAAITNQLNDLQFDFDKDGIISPKDLDVLIDDVLQVKRGDVNLDGEVDFADFLSLSIGFGKEASWSDGNFDLNGTTDFADFLVLAQNFGVSTNEDDF